MSVRDHVASFYAATVGSLPAPAASLRGDRRADVCIVGGGYTGLSAALELAGQGLDVTVLEAHRLGWGCSGRNGGQVSAGFKDTRAVEKALGTERARALFALTVEAVDLVRHRMERFGIDAEWVPGHFTAACRPRQLGALTRERDHWAA